MNDFNLLQKEFQSEIEQLPTGTKVQTTIANLGSGTIIAVEKGDGLLAPRYVVLWDKTQETSIMSSISFTKVV